MSEKPRDVWAENKMEKPFVVKVSEHPDAAIIRKMIEDNDPELEEWESNPRHSQSHQGDFGADRYTAEHGGGLVIDVKVHASGSPKIVPERFFKDLREEVEKGK